MKKAKMVRTCFCGESGCDGNMQEVSEKKVKHQWTEKGFFNIFGINVRECSEAKVPYLMTGKQIVLIGDGRVFNYDYDDNAKLIITEAL